MLVDVIDHLSHAYRNATSFLNRWFWAHFLGLHCPLGTNFLTQLGLTALLLNASPVSGMSSLSIPPIRKQRSIKVGIAQASPFLTHIVQSFCSWPLGSGSARRHPEHKQSNPSLHLHFCSDLEAYPGAQKSHLLKPPQFIACADFQVLQNNLF